MAVVELGYRPLEKYAGFHSAPEPDRLLVGGFGSGKSVALCAEAIIVGLENPGSRILMTRKTAPELRDTLEPAFLETMPHELYRASKERRSGGHIESLTLPNGTKYLFRSIDDWRKLKSLNLSWIFWDELNEFDEETFLAMQGRLRQRDPTPEAQAMGTREVTRRGNVGATNDNGHDWVWKRYVSPQHRKAGTAYWIATSLDNPYLPPTYISSLLEYPEPWVRRYVLCTFDEFAGQIYEEWGERHVVSAEDIPKGELMWMGMDPGTRNPTAGLWVVVDQTERRMVAVAEYQQSGLAADTHAEAWRRIENELKPRQVRWRVADPSIMVRDRGSNMSLHTQYHRLRFPFDLGPGKHKDRIPMLGKLIHLNQFQCTAACPMLFEQLKGYRWEDLTPQMRSSGADPREVPVQGDDHLVDCAQYLSSRWVIQSKVAAPEEHLSPWARTSREIQRKTRAQARAGTLGADHDLGGIPV